MMSSIKNIIFDLGGVVIDLDRERCVESFTNIGFPEADTLIDFYHPAEFFNRLERGEINTQEVCEIIRSTYPCKASDKDICMAYSDFLAGIPLFKLRMIESLRKRGFKVYALSNINEIVMPRVRELFETDGKTIDHYFDKLYLSFEMKSLKPDAQIFEMLIADSGIIPSETLYIDDSERNIEAGKAFGLQLYLASAHEDYSHLFEEI